MVSAKAVVEKVVAEGQEKLEKLEEEAEADRALSVLARVEAFHNAALMKGRFAVAFRFVG